MNLNFFFILLIGLLAYFVITDTNTKKSEYSECIEEPYQIFGCRENWVRHIDEKKSETSLTSPDQIYTEILWVGFATVRSSGNEAILPEGYLSRKYCIKRMKFRIKEYNDQFHKPYGCKFLDKNKSKFLIESYRVN